MSFHFSSFSLSLSSKKENEQLSGGHFVFPARCAVLICPVNPGQVVERSVPAPGAQRASGGRRHSRHVVRPPAPGVAYDDVASGNDRPSRQVTSGEVRLISTGVCVHVVVSMCACARAGARACVARRRRVGVRACACTCVNARLSYACMGACVFPFLCPVYVTRS